MYTKLHEQHPSKTTDYLNKSAVVLDMGFVVCPERRLVYTIKILTTALFVDLIQQRMQNMLSDSAQHTLLSASGNLLSTTHRVDRFPPSALKLPTVSPLHVSSRD